MTVFFSKIFYDFLMFFRLVEFPCIQTIWGIAWSNSRRSKCRPTGGPVQLSRACCWTDPRGAAPCRVNECCPTGRDGSGPIDPANPPWWVKRKPLFTYHILQFVIAALLLYYVIILAIILYYSYSYTLFCLLYYCVHYYVLF